MKLGARDIVAGEAANVARGQTTAHVRLEIGGGAVITASMTHEAVDEPGLRAGDAAYAVIKAPDVMHDRQGLTYVHG